MNKSMVNDHIAPAVESVRQFLALHPTIEIAQPLTLLLAVISRAGLDRDCVERPAVFVAGDGRRWLMRRESQLDRLDFANGEAFVMERSFQWKTIDGDFDVIDVGHGVWHLAHPQRGIIKGSIDWIG